MQNHAIMFHHFHHANTLHGQGSICEDEFEAILKHIGINNIISPTEWYERSLAGTLSPNDICLTFDDSLMSQYSIALPVLDKYNLKAFFFIYSAVFQGLLENLEIYRTYRTNYFENVDDFYAAFENALTIFYSQTELNQVLVKFDANHYLKEFPFYTSADKRFRYIRDEILGQDRYFKTMDQMILNSGLQKTNLARDLWMNDECLKHLSNNDHAIGLHSYSHPTRLAHLDAKEQANEYRKNFEHIYLVTGKKPFAMSHPCNSYNKDTLAILNDMNIQIGFRSNMSAMENRTLLEYKREDHANILRELKR